MGEMIKRRRTWEGIKQSLAHGREEVRHAEYILSKCTQRWLALQGIVVWWVGRCLSASAAWGGFNCNQLQ